MKILLTGASGFIGSHVLQALLEPAQEAHQIIACTHHQKSNKTNKNIKFITLDFMDMQSIEACMLQLQLETIDVLINCVGIIAENRHQKFEQLHFQAPARLFKACERAGVKRIIQISALGANEAAITPYHTSKRAADNVLRQTRLDWFILCPSLVYGVGGKSMALFQRLSNLPLIPLIGNGKQMIQPVHISDVIATVMRCLETDVKTRQIINVVGDRPINYRDWLIALRSHAGKSIRKPRFIKLPFPLMLKLSLLGKLTHHPFFNPENLRMLQQNNMADSSKLRAFLGRKPLSVSQTIHQSKPANRNQP